MVTEKLIYSQHEVVIEASEVIMYYCTLCYRWGGRFSPPEGKANDLLVIVGCLVFKQALLRICDNGTRRESSFPVLKEEWEATFLNTQLFALRCGDPRAQANSCRNYLSLLFEKVAFFERCGDTLFRSKKKNRRIEESKNRSDHNLCNFDNNLLPPTSKIEVLLR
jgi:hypothetical protein